MTQENAQISKSLFGPTAKATDILFIGSIIGSISGIGPLYEAQPILFFVPFAWFLYVLTKMYSFVKNPRKNDWPFILGILYTDRRNMALHFVRRKTIELFLICSIATIGFLCVRSLAYHDFAIKETIASFEIMFGEILCSMGLFWILVQAKIIRPSKKDHQSQSLFIFPDKSFLSATRATLSLRFSNFSFPFLSHEQKIILRRQLLYVIRTAPINTALFIIIAFIFYAIILVFAPATQSIFLGMACCIPPTIVLMEITTAMSDSAEKIALCPYYFFNPRDIYSVNLLLCAMVFALFLLGLCIKIVFFGHLFDLISLLRLVSSFASCLALCLCIALRWNKSEWDGTSAALFGAVCLCCILGIAIPYFGIVFPVAACFLVLALK
jgi:hypothetical protein